MRKVILTKGLPASGKSTWAKAEQAKNPNIVRVNKDDLRNMLHNGKWSKSHEEFVLKIRDYIVLQAIAEDHDVIVDDTNLHSKHKNHINHLVADQATVEVKDFTDVSLEECIKRDQKRQNYVGEKVIKIMYKQYLQPQVPTIQWNKKLPNSIICDMDGTLALFGDANPYDRDFTKDTVNAPVANIVGLNHEHKNKIILVSGRQEIFREQTEWWLKNNFIKYDALFMRPAGDQRKDYIIKNEIYDREIKGKYNVLFVLDDRNQTVDFWRSVGLTCLQVGEGDF